MRIDQSTPRVETAQAERLTEANGKSESASKTDRAQAQSDVSLQHADLRNQVENVPDIRQDRVAALRQAMQDGTYHVSNEDLANAMFNTLVQKK